MAATPYKLLEGRKEVAKQRVNLTLLQLHTEYSEALGDPELKGHLRQRAFFVGASTRPAVNQGLADYVPIFLSEIPNFFARASSLWVLLLYRFHRLTNTAIAA